MDASQRSNKNLPTCQRATGKKFRAFNEDFEHHFSLSLALSLSLSFSESRTGMTIERPRETTSTINPRENNNEWYSKVKSSILLVDLRKKNYHIVKSSFLQTFRQEKSTSSIQMLQGSCHALQSSQIFLQFAAPDPGGSTKNSCS